MNAISECSKTTREGEQPAASVAPRSNLKHDAEGYTLKVEMPGVTKAGVDITVNEGKLLITGKRESVATNGRTVYSERPAAHYSRVFELDPSIDTERISAGIEQGLLTVKLHKAEAAKPRKIAVA